MSIFFIHIPRTMGTTLKNIFLARHFQPGQYQLTLRWDHCLSGMPIGNHIKFGAGHLPYGAKAMFQQAPVLITILRDPVQRAWSMYHFIQRTERHYLHKEANEMSLEEFAANPATNCTISNLQCKYLAFDKDPGVFFHGLDGRECTKKLEGFSGPLLHEKAIEIISRDEFRWVCIADKFEESVKLLWLALGLPELPITPGLKAHSYQIPKLEYKILEELNLQDILLYEWASRVFTGGLNEEN